MCLLDSKTGLNVNVFLKQFKGGSKEVIKWIQTFDVQAIAVEQVAALEKLLPDTHTVAITLLHNLIMYYYFRLISLNLITETKNC